MVEVCVPGLVWNETRQDETGGHFWIAKTVTRLLMSGLVAQENSGKIWEKFRMGRDYSVPLRKFLNGLEMNKNPSLFLKFGTWQEISCKVLFKKNKTNQYHLISNCLFSYNEVYWVNLLLSIWDVIVSQKSLTNNLKPQKNSVKTLSPSYFTAIKHNSTLWEHACTCLWRLSSNYAYRSATTAG